MQRTKGVAEDSSATSWAQAMGVKADIVGGRGKYLGRINHGWTQINTDKMGHAYMVLTILP